VFVVSSRRRHTRSTRDWSSDVCSSDLGAPAHGLDRAQRGAGEQIAAERSENERDGAADEEGGTQAAQGLGPVLARRADDEDDVQIGRASCRERETMGGGGGAVKEEENG